MAVILGCGFSTQCSSRVFNKLLTLRGAASANCELTLVTLVGQKSLWALGLLVDSRDHVPPTARAVRAPLRRTRLWFERSLHVPRKLCSRACQLSLYGSVRQSQNLGCLKDRETAHDP